MFQFSCRHRAWLNLIPIAIGSHVFRLGQTNLTNGCFGDGNENSNTQCCNVTRPSSTLFNALAPHGHAELLLVLPDSNLFSLAMVRINDVLSIKLCCHSTTNNTFELKPRKCIKRKYKFEVYRHRKIHSYSGGIFFAHHPNVLFS